MNILQDQKICPLCKNKVTAEAKFCGRCGYQFPAQESSHADEDMKRCAGCGRKIRSAAQFCKYCGLPSDQTVQARQDPAVFRSGAMQSPGRMPDRAPRSKYAEPLPVKPRVVPPKKKKGPGCFTALFMAFVIFFTGTFYPGWIRMIRKPPAAPGGAVTGVGPGGGSTETGNENRDYILPDTERFEKVPLTGKSRPFELSPMDGFRIRGEKDVLDQDREFRVTDLEDEVFNAFEEKVSKQPGSELILAFDLDAGLKSTEVLPGKYSIEFDLNELEIPEDIQPYVSIVRYVPELDEPVELISVVKDGVVTAECDQNSVFGLIISGIKALCTIKITLAGGIAIGLLVAPLGIWGLKEWHQHKYFIKNPGNALTLQMDPRYLLYFKYADAAMPEERLDTGYRKDGYYSNYVEHAVADEWIRAYQKRLETVYEAAGKEYEKVISASVKAGDRSGKTETVMEKLIRRIGQRKKAVKAIDKVKFLKDYADKDEELNRLKGQFVLPESIEVIKDSIETGLDYIKDQKIKLPSYVMEYQVLPKSEFSGISDYGAQDYSDLHSGFMRINVDSLFPNGDKSAGIGSDNKEAMLLTCIHETLHIIQPDYVKERFLFDTSDYIGFGIGSLGTQFFVNLKFCEMMACAFEFDAATHFYNSGRNKNCPNHNEESGEFKALGLVSRNDSLYHMFSLNSEPRAILHTIPVINTSLLSDTKESVNTGYSLGNLIDYLREKQRPQTSISNILNAGYKHDHNVVESLKEAFRIDSTEKFNELWVGYCDAYRDVIAMDFPGSSPNLPAEALKDIDNSSIYFKVKKNEPVVTVNASDNPYSFLAFTFESDPSNKLKDKGKRKNDDRRFSVWARPSDKAKEDPCVLPRMLSMKTSRKGFDINPNLYMKPEDSVRDTTRANNYKMLGLINTDKPQTSSAYDVLLLFEPDKPEIELVEEKDMWDVPKQGKLKIKVPDLPKQAREKYMLFGVKTVVKNKVNGKEYVLNSDINNKEPGKTLEKDLHEFGVSWGDRTKPVDLEICQYQYDLAEFGEVRSPYSVSWELKRNKEEETTEEETESFEVVPETSGPHDHHERMDCTVGVTFLSSELQSAEKREKAVLTFDNGTFKIDVPSYQATGYYNGDPSQQKTNYAEIGGYSITGKYSSMTTNTGPYGFTPGGREIDFRQDTITFMPSALHGNCKEWYTDIWGEDKAGKLHTESDFTFYPEEFRASWGGSTDGTSRWFHVKVKGKRRLKYDRPGEGWYDQHTDETDDFEILLQFYPVSSSTDFKMPNGNWYEDEKMYKWDWLIDVGNFLDGRQNYNDDGTLKR